MDKILTNIVDMIEGGKDKQFVEICEQVADFLYGDENKKRPVQ